ncbi:MAG: DUF115 domain-containing protein [Phycisphaerales bacterium]|nr:DUF115 domain-containing protein [Phycisphaerales bacterium]
MEPLPANPALLDRNLAALGTRSPRTAEAVRAAAPRADVTIWRAPDGCPTGRIGDADTGQMLASRRGPADEAKRLVGTLDLRRQAAVIVLGMGVGNHVMELARRLGNYGAVIVYEPDVGLLRAVLERIDCAAWILLSRVSILTDPEDTAQIAGACAGLEGILAAGTVYLEHPASTARLGASAGRFGANFASVMHAVRTNIVTTLVQVDTSVRNQLQNLRWYTRCPGVKDLEGAAAGKACVVVAAGPSLRTTIDALAQPGVRDRVVIIAVQTVLKTLLARGITPHFVTALDYHEISARFYEGLTAADVEGVTLVVETKANPAILRAFPGRIRCVGDPILDDLLPDSLRRDMGRVPPGATVAHLAYYLARYLGCDPVIMTGQDLAFTDNQYYAPHAAIHGVWGSELSEFRTLEMLEWERIARMKNSLRRVPGQDGQTLYTDDQMHTYLVQFERDFHNDTARGLRVVDATQGGALKKHTQPMSLREAIDRFGSPAPIALPTPPSDLPETRWRTTAECLRRLRQETGRVAILSRETGGLLARMLECQDDANAINPLIEESHRNAERVAKLDVAFRLVQHVNQAGQLARFRADRAIELNDALTPLQRQRCQIERDLRNVNWLVDVAEHVGTLLDSAKVAVEQGRFVTRDVIPQGEGESRSGGRVAAFIAADAERNGLDQPRDIHAAFLGQRPALLCLLDRLERCEHVGEVVILTPTPEAIHALIEQTRHAKRVAIESVEPAAFRARQSRVAAGRAWSSSCWRGGIANLSIYDEAFHPALLAPIMERRCIDAAVILHADWALADPALIDACVERHLEHPAAHAITFTQAPPGIAGCVMSASCVRDLAHGGDFATIGGVLGYVPSAPQVDPIAKGVCVSIPPALRDLAARCIPESTLTRAWLARACDGFGDTTSGARLGEAIADLLSDEPSPRVVHADVRHPSMADSEEAARAILALGREGEALGVTLGPEATRHADLPRLIRALKHGRAFVHVRTALAHDHNVVRAMMEAEPDVVSIDLHATDAAAYQRITGVNAFDRVTANVHRLLDERGVQGGLPGLWVVPRIARRHAVASEIEHFYDHWLMHAGACVIDPPPPGDRYEALPIPAHARDRVDRGMVLLPPTFVAEVSPGLYTLRAGA